MSGTGGGVCPASQLPEVGSCRGHPALVPAWTDDPQTQTPRVLQASAHHLISFWRKTKGLNKAASPSTLTSFKRPLLKAPGSGKHGLLGLCQQREASGGQRLPGLTRACSCTGEQAAPRPVGKPSRQRLVLLASVRGSGGRHCLEAAVCCSPLMLHFTVSPAYVVSAHSADSALSPRLLARQAAPRHSRQQVQGLNIWGAALHHQG